MTVDELQRIINQTGEQCPVCRKPVHCGEELCSHCGEVLDS